MLSAVAIRVRDIRDSTICQHALGTPEPHRRMRAILDRQNGTRQRCADALPMREDTVRTPAVGELVFPVEHANHPHRVRRFLYEAGGGPSFETWAAGAEKARSALQASRLFSNDCFSA